MLINILVVIEVFIPQAQAVDTLAKPAQPGMDNPVGIAWIMQHPIDRLQQP
nr:hypothetical protein [Thiolapillus sp.]